MKFWVGTSGYSYKPWLGKFYPERLAAKEMLRFYGTRLPAVEINNTFYRLPKKTVLETWAGQVPSGFRFVLKAPQRITHIKRLQDAESELEYLLSISEVMGEKVGAMLFQLPPNLRKDLERLKSFLSLLPAERRIALRERNCALCFAEFAEDEGRELVSTATWGYIRLRRPDYDQNDLIDWKARILEQEWDHVYVFFKHEDEGIGPRLAGEFLELTRSL